MDQKNTFQNIKKVIPGCDKKTKVMKKILNKIFHKCNFNTTDGYKEGSIYVRNQLCGKCNKQREVIIYKGQFVILDKDG